MDQVVKDVFGGLQVQVVGGAGGRTLRRPFPGPGHVAEAPRRRSTRAGGCRSWALPR